jgi:DNA-binding MarR family transcriptional regulator
VLAALRAAPGSTTASVATATGISASTVGATISRLVKQERVQRLQEGGYAPAEPPADPAASGEL